MVDVVAEERGQPHWDNPASTQQIVFKVRVVSVEPVKPWEETEMLATMTRVVGLCIRTSC